mmetsp:Transcript_31070/g.87078  ORF Transcript_31070/g.87078 Transcript_31070/m.87078 type:complete len:517 (+) Transcript_31070:69-1619(+)
MDLDDELRVTTFIPTVKSTLASFQEDVLAGSALEEREVTVCIEDLEDLLHKTRLLIEKHVDDEERLPVLLSTYERLETVVDAIRTKLAMQIASQEDGAVPAVAVSAKKSAVEASMDLEHNPDQDVIGDEGLRGLASSMLEEDEGKEGRAEGADPFSLPESPAPARRVAMEAGTLDAMSVRDLKEQLGSLGVSYEHCIEKRELRNLLALYVDVPDGAKGEPPEDDLPDGEEFECPVCYCDYERSDTYLLQCAHRYCRDCLVRYLTGLITTADVENILCPDPDCGQPVQYGDMKAVLSAEVLEKYDRFAVLACLKHDSTARWCPNPQCENVSVGEPPNPQEPKIVCDSCGESFCYNCKDTWHEGKTCVQHLNSRTPVDKKTRKWMKRRGVQNCPQCGLATIRSTGCPTMTCTGCGSEWEWKGDEDETTLEKVAYFYPRSVKYIATSREAHENDKSKADEIKTNIAAGSFAALILSPALLVTIPTLIPALAVTAGRKTKHGIEELIDKINHDSSDEENN